MKPKHSRPFLTYACVLSLGSLGLMVWSLFDPRPIPVVLAMSAGQVLGTSALAMFLYVVIADVRGEKGAREMH